MYIETITDFLATRQQLGLTFLSMGNAFWERQEIYEFPISDTLTESEIQEFNLADFVSHDLTEYYFKLRDRHVITNTGTVGCDHSRMTDPLWYVKPYHCFTGYAVQEYNYVVLNRRTMSVVQFKFLRRLIRAVVESDIKRRINRNEARLHHLSSMTAALFEPHESALHQLDFTTLRDIIIGSVTLQVIIICVSIMYHLSKFIKYKIQFIYFNI